MTAENLHHLYTRERLFWRFGYLVGALLITYLYFINSAVFDLVGRERLVATLAEKQSAVVSLETEYMERSADITSELAASLGFQDAATHAIFVTSAGPVLLGLNNQN